MRGEQYSEEPAGETLDQGGSGAGRGMEESQPHENTFFLPDFPGAESVQPGDTLTLKVVGRSAQGELEVEKEEAEQGGEAPWKADLKKTMSNEGGE